LTADGLGGYLPRGGREGDFAGGAVSDVHCTGRHDMGFGKVFWTVCLLSIVLLNVATLEGG